MARTCAQVFRGQRDVLDVGGDRLVSRTALSSVLLWLPCRVPCLALYMPDFYQPNLYYFIGYACRAPSNNSGSCAQSSDSEGAADPAREWIQGLAVLQLPCAACLQYLISVSGSASRACHVSQAMFSKSCKL
jgi:hypothetical protein